MLSVKEIDAAVRAADDNDIHAARGWIARHSVDHAHFATRVGTVRYIDLHYPSGWEGFVASMTHVSGPSDRRTAQYVRDHRSGMLIMPGDVIADVRGNRWEYVALAAPTSPYAPGQVRVRDLDPYGVGEVDMYAYTLGLYFTDLLANPV